MKTKKLQVSLPGYSVGELTRNKDGLTRWTPNAFWELDQMPRLGIDFLRTRGVRQEGTELPSWFENLMPERGSTMRVRLCERYGLSEGQNFSLMKALGSSLIGAVEVFEYEEHRNEDLTMPLLDNNSTTKDPDQFSSLTGMQLKFSMSMTNERLAIAAHQGASQWIVKIAGKDFDELAEVENSTMNWARHSGFDIPDHQTIPHTKLDGIPDGWLETSALAYAVRRFDRRDDGSKVHQEDFCQALALRPNQKYSSISFDGLLRFVIDTCGEDQGREMARRIGFMLACGNTDAHLKNWSLLWGTLNRPKLTPGYDLVSTIAWERLGWKRKGGPELALKLGGQRCFRKIDNLSLQTVARNSGATWAEEEIERAICQARDTWPSVSDEAPTRMHTAIIEHWRSVPLLSEIGLHK
jgi:serine/threonine-protein kinase HipA